MSRALSLLGAVFCVVLGAWLATEILVALAEDRLVLPFGLTLQRSVTPWGFGGALFAYLLAIYGAMRVAGRLLVRAWRDN